MTWAQLRPAAPMEVFRKTRRREHSATGPAASVRMQAVSPADHDIERRQYAGASVNEIVTGEPISLLVPDARGAAIRVYARCNIEVCLPAPLSGVC